MDKLIHELKLFLGMVMVAIQGDHVENLVKDGLILHLALVAKALEDFTGKECGPEDLEDYLRTHHPIMSKLDKLFDKIKGAGGIVVVAQETGNPEELMDSIAEQLANLFNEANQQKPKEEKEEEVPVPDVFSSFINDIADDKNDGQTK